MNSCECAESDAHLTVFSYHVCVFFWLEEGLSKLANIFIVFTYWLQHNRNLLRIQKKISTIDFGCDVIHSIHTIQTPLNQIYICQSWIYFFPSCIFILQCLSISHDSHCTKSNKYIWQLDYWVDKAIRMRNAIRFICIYCSKNEKSLMYRSLYRAYAPNVM